MILTAEQMIKINANEIPASLLNVKCSCCRSQVLYFVNDINVGCLMLLSLILITQL